MAQNQKIGCSEGQDRPFSANGRLRASLEKLEAGDHPNVLDMMHVLSVLSEAMSPSVQKTTQLEILLEEMSQNKCRFCD